MKMVSLVEDKEKKDTDESAALVPKDEVVVDAEEVYLLLNDRYRISRNLRVQWYLKTLDTVIDLANNKFIPDDEDEIALVSAYSSSIKDAPQRVEKFRITSETKFSFLSKKYCYVYVLDLRPSIANVDLQHGTVLIDEVPIALARCLEALVQSFYLPGSSQLFVPEIYISVLIYHPFYNSDSNNSIIHGYKICPDNLKHVISLVKAKLNKYMDFLRLNLIRARDSGPTPITADLSLLNMIRFGLIVLNLLPENSYQGIVIVTDGNFDFPDSNTMENVLARLRMTMTSLSFIQVGSPMHPDSPLGFVPYTDMMDFIAKTSFGAYFQISPDYVDESEANSFNVFHKSFLVWSFHYESCPYPIQLRSAKWDESRVWKIDNPYFYSSPDYVKKDQQWIRKRQFTNKFHGSLAQVLCYRLREGFFIKSIDLKSSENYVEVSLVLLWRSNVLIEYIISGALHQDLNELLQLDDEQKMLNCDVYVESEYTFLHDVTCQNQAKKKFTIHRANKIKQFCALIKNFAETEKIGIHFHKYAHVEMCNAIPRAVSNGLPLFVLSLQSNTPEVSHTQEEFLKFAQYWRPICMVDIHMCHKSSLHTVQINLLLQHDQPLPEHLYHPNNSGRYDNIQCNQAMSALNVTLKEWSSFILLENHSYIKMIEEDDAASSHSFYLLRISPQPPYIILHLAFFGGTTNSLRNQIVCELSQRLAKCKLPHRNLSSSRMQTSVPSVKEEFENNSDPGLLEDEEILHFSVDTKSHHDSVSQEDSRDYLTENGTDRESMSESTVVSLDDKNQGATQEGASSVALTSNLNCFILLNRSLERMLIRYERVPRDFFTCFGYEEDIKQTIVTAQQHQKSYLNIFQTLTRSFYHKRYIWNTHQQPQTRRLGCSAISKILSALTTRRIQEGFHLAYNDSGIVDLVTELTMRDELGNDMSCLVQYIIFPSNVTVRNHVNGDAEFDEEPSSELDAEHLIVTECWIEPQSGRVVQSPSLVSTTISASTDNQSFLAGLTYEEIADAFFQTDFKLINSLLTYEHLVAFTTFDANYSGRAEEFYRPVPVLTVRDGQRNEVLTNRLLKDRFNNIKYGFDLLALVAKSQQALIKFPTLKPCHDSGHPEDSSFDGDFANTVLYSEFLLKILGLNEKEIELSHSDTIIFIRMVNQKLEELNLRCLFENVDTFETDEKVKFKCFCKQISENCIVLTILPQSFHTLKAVTRNSLGQESQNSSLAVPILVYKLTFANLCGILLKSHEESEVVVHSPDYNLFFDYTQNLDEFYFDSISKYDANLANKFSFSSNTGPNQTEIILEHYVKSIEIFYWNAFTDAIYKALRYKIPINSEDIEFVTNRICHKFEQVIDLTEFLIYTCRHLKPILNSYFEKNPHHSIVDLVHYITHGLGRNRNSDFWSLKEILDVLMASSGREDSCNSLNNELKFNFESRIRDHFERISENWDANKQLYFFNYENIQRRKYMLDDADQNLDQTRQNLFDFYQKLDLGVKKLHEVLQMRELQSENSCKVDSEVISENGKSDHNSESEEYDPDADESDVQGASDVDEDDATFVSMFLSKPFFVNFQYFFSFRDSEHNIHTHSSSINSIPTCLTELFGTISDLENLEYKLDNFRICLNIKLITQNFENSVTYPMTKKLSVHSMDTQQFMARNSNTLTNIPHLATILDNFQLLNYREFVSKIEWLIRDEIVSMSHNSFPICPSTLRMIVSHIKAVGSANTEKILVEKVDLKFIVDDDENCIQQFKNMLVELKFSNFQICRFEEFFYVILQSIDIEEDRMTLLYTADDNSVEFDCDQCFVLNEEYFEDYPVQDRISYTTIEQTNSLTSHFSPNFWLIMTIETEVRQPLAENTNHVWLYFHSRQNIFLCGLQIFNRLKKSLDLLCKKINQKLLLDQLNETRKCDELLISSEDKDPFAKAQIRKALNSTPISHRIDQSDLNPIEPPDFDLIEDDKNLAFFKSCFLPGTFGCEVVWDKHFALHSRLNGRDQGANTVKAFLASFVVPNRNNLYVYKEKSSAVFYFRIYEVECDHKHSFEEKISFGSFNESLDLRNHQQGDQKPINYYDNIISYLNENPVEEEHDRDNDSIASSSNVPFRDPSQPVLHCILLNVHGISEPTKEIREDMVNIIQKKLEEVTLDNFILTLSRRPNSKFAYDDICFIQSRNSLSENFYFVISPDYMPYLTNLKAYIRQNMSTFMYNPKYAENQPEAHFKLYKNEEFHCVLDEDVFIQNHLEESQGIACVILSVVSRDKMQLSPVMDFRLTTTDMNDFQSCNFENITSATSQARENPRVQFYINFQVWACGKVSLDTLKQKLTDVIRHALWDFNLEFKVFKLCIPNIENRLIQTFSAPIGFSNLRARKSGIALLDSIAFKRYSANLSHSLQNESSEGFKFERSQTFDPSAVKESDRIENSNKLLNSIERILLPWMNFGHNMQVPSVKIFNFSLVMRNSISAIFREFVKTNTLGMTVQYLSEDMNGLDILENCEYGRGFKILFRHENMWNSTKLNSTPGSEDDSELCYASQVKKLSKNEHSTFRFAPIFPCGAKVFTESVSNLNVAEPKALNSASTEELVSMCIASRQKFLLFHVEGRSITMYFYNWPTNYLDHFKSMFANLVLWHNCRSLLQQSLVAQKTGRLYDLPFERYTFEEILRISQVTMKDLNQLQMSPQLTYEQLFFHVELLLKHVSPTLASKELKEMRDPRSPLKELIFESKNYNFIFSSLNKSQEWTCRNLFEYFQAQFSSNYNNYLRDLKELSRVWELPGNKFNTPTMDKIVALIKKYGRLSHFCLTPFLFSEKWRHAVSVIRDHTLQITSRGRHLSGVSLISGKTSMDEFTPNKRSRRKSGPPNMFENSVMNVQFGNENGEDFISVRKNFMQEYVQYLQSLGFSSLKSQKPVQSSLRTHQMFASKFSVNSRDQFGPRYCIKNVFGGLLMFEIGFCEPHVYCHLYAFDSAQLAAWGRSDVSCASSTTFLDELDSIKVRMHLHSFAYDYHLRAIQSYISGVKLVFTQGYHLISFLDDFIKYYQKAPNYARNYVFTDTIKFESKRTPAEKLYDYIIGNNKMYGLEVFLMKPTNSLEKFADIKNEYVMIQLSSYQVPNSSDEAKFYQDESFNVGVLVTFQKSKDSSFLSKETNNNLLTLKFFIVLTSQRELFPKLISLTDHRGAFRSIRLLSSSFSNSRKSSILHSGEGSMEGSFNNSNKLSERLGFNRNLYEGLSLDAVQSFPGITDEKINYMGYFNTHEINMLNLLGEKAADIKRQLKTIIAAAEIDCRRDYLWNCFLPSNNIEQLSMEHLDELLTLVKSIRFNDYDPTLAEFYKFNHHWYRLLAQKLEIRFDTLYRKFQTDQQFKMMLFRKDCNDCFILFEYNLNTNISVNFQLVFKRAPTTVIDEAFLASCDPQHHQHVEYFVNIATAHMWNIIVG